MLSLELGELDMTQPSSISHWKPLKNSIVVAYLDLETCQGAIEAARSMLAPGGTIHLAHAVAPMVTSVPGVVLDGDLHSDLEKQHTQRIQKELSRFEGTEFSVHVSMGDPVSVVHRVVEDAKAELIVVASHGRSGFSRWFFGSVAEHLLRDAPCPILVLSAGQEE